MMLSENPSIHFLFLLMDTWVAGLCENSNLFITENAVFVLFYKSPETPAPTHPATLSRPL